MGDFVLCLRKKNVATYKRRELFFLNGSQKLTSLLEGQALGQNVSLLAEKPNPLIDT